MKKIFQFALALIISLGCIVSVSAKTEQDLIDYASQTFTIAGKQVSNPEVAAMVKSYLADNDLTETEIDKIIADADKIVEIMNNEGVTDPTKLSSTAKDSIRSISTEIANITDVVIDYNSTTKAVKVTGKNNGKVYGSLPINGSDRLASTGADYTGYIVVSGLAVVLAAVLFYRKSKVNA